MHISEDEKIDGVIIYLQRYDYSHFILQLAEQNIANVANSEKVRHVLRTDSWIWTEGGQGNVGKPAKHISNT